MGGRLRVDAAAVSRQPETVSWILSGGFMAGNSRDRTLLILAVEVGQQ